MSAPIGPQRPQTGGNSAAASQLQRSLQLQSKYQQQSPLPPPPTAVASSSRGANSTSLKSKKRKFVRAAGGQTWEDPTLSEWDPDDYRIFCGDLGNDVNDDILTKTFNRYPSFVKAKVVRDKRTTKSKGYGFVSFKEPQDFTRAIKEMDGKYVGSRPIKLRKSTWKDRSLENARKKQC